MTGKTPSDLFGVVFDSRAFRDDRWVLWRDDPDRRWARVSWAKAPRGRLVYVATKAATHKATAYKSCDLQSRRGQKPLHTKRRPTDRLANWKETYWLLCWANGW